MRILFVNSHGTDVAYGGAERYVRVLATEMSERGHAVEILSAFPERDPSGLRTRALHGRDWRENTSRRLRNHLGDLVSAPWPRLVRTLREVEPDLIHTNNLPGIGTGVWEAARRGGIPVVHSLHDYYLLCPRTTLTRRDGSRCNPHPQLCGARSRRLVRWHGAVDTLIGVSRHILNVHRDLFPGTALRVVPPPLSQLDGPPLPPVGNSPTTVGFVGALTPTKGISILLGAAHALARLGLKLRVAGDGPMRGEVERAEHIDYVGHLPSDELVRFLGTCDLGVVPSQWDEPGPLVVTEWLAAGRPVLATRRGGLAEAEKRGGVMAIDDSPEALIGQIARLRDSREWRRLVETLPRIDGDADTQRWVGQHEHAYQVAVYVAASRPAA